MQCFTTPFDRPYRVVLCFDRSDAAPTRIAVIVVWRAPVEPRPIAWSDLLRRLRYRLGIDPLRRNVSFTGIDGLLWMGSAGVDGEQETLFHARRRVVRVLGRDFAMSSDGPPTILLVDETPTTPEAPRVVQTLARGSLSARPFLKISRQFPIDSEPSLFADAWQQRVWDEFVAAEPDIRTFMKVERNG